MGAYFCPACGYAHRMMSMVKLHFRKSHDVSFCYVCGRKYKSASSLMSHCLRMRDEDHQLLYYFLKSSQNGGSTKMLAVSSLVKGMLRGNRRWATPNCAETVA